MRRLEWLSYVWIGIFISYQGEWEIDKSKVLYFNNIIMTKVRIKSIKVKNYRSFWPTEQEFIFPDENFKRPIAIIGYNNCGKTNLMNLLLYATQVSYLWKDSIEIDDFHNREIDNKPEFLVELDSSVEKKYDGKSAVLNGFHKLEVKVDGSEIEWSKIQSLNTLNLLPNWKPDENWQAFGAGRYFPIYAINFHKIKDEISTQKTSWGNLKSFLAKHIKKLVDNDKVMKARQEDFQISIREASKRVLEWEETETVENKKGKSNLFKFIEKIKEYYNQNLRNNAIEIDFSLPEYEDIFLQMIFKIGLNGNSEKMVPIAHFWDGYISMFVMAVIQAIAEENSEDKALFLFEEPESFLHENHQEYFYKAVLCKLAEKWHQVIYTTHSARMIDMFDTKGIIRLEMDKDNQTIKKYNKPDQDCAFWNAYDSEEQEVPLADYNTFIKTIEPNLNKILFSKKVILVEGPNDLLVYKYIIKKKVEEYVQNKHEILNKEEYAETYLNYENIVIIPHHWKSTVLYLIELCKHFWIDYFVINDWDLLDINRSDIENIANIPELHVKDFYANAGSVKKGQITINFKLLKSSQGKIHFNLPKLEWVIGYDQDDKDPIKIYQRIKSSDFQISGNLFPQSLASFLWVNETSIENNGSVPQENDDLPF